MLSKNKKESPCNKYFRQNLIDLDLDFLFLRLYFHVSGWTISPHTYHGLRTEC